MQHNKTDVQVLPLAEDKFLQLPASLRELTSSATARIFATRLADEYSFIATDVPDLSPMVLSEYSAASAVPLVPPKKSLYSCSGKLTLSYL